MAHAPLPPDALTAALQKEEPRAGKKPSTLKALTKGADVMAEEQASVIAALLTYVDTDAIRFRAENPLVLAEQEPLLRPLLVGLGERFDVHIATTQGLAPLPENPALTERVQHFLETLTPYQLSAALFLTQTGDSVLLAIAALVGLVDAEQFMAAAYVEQDIQTARYGKDEAVEAKRNARYHEVKDAFLFLSLLRE